MTNLDELGTTSQYNFVTPYSEEYCRHVRAHNDKGWSNWSAERCFTSEVYPPGVIFTSIDGAMTMEDDYIWNIQNSPRDYINAEAVDFSPDSVGLNLKELHVYKRKDPNSDGDFTDGTWFPEHMLNNGAFQTCSDRSPCSISPPHLGVGMTWQPNKATDEGFWQSHINAFSNDDDGVSSRGRCTGNPDWTPAATWWSNCDENNNDDLVNLTLIGPPYGKINSPADGTVLTVGNATTFVAEGTDEGNNLMQIGLYRRPVLGSGDYGDADDWVGLDAPVGYDNESASGSSYTITSNGPLPQLIWQFPILGWFTLTYGMS